MPPEGRQIIRLIHTQAGSTPEYSIVTVYFPFACKRQCRRQQGMSLRRWQVRRFAAVFQSCPDLVRFAVADQAIELTLVQFRPCCDRTLARRRLIAYFTPLTITPYITPPDGFAGDFCPLLVSQHAKNVRQAPRIGKAKIESLAISFHYAPSRQTLGYPFRRFKRRDRANHRKTVAAGQYAAQ